MIGSLLRIMRAWQWLQQDVDTNAEDLGATPVEEQGRRTALRRLFLCVLHVLVNLTLFVVSLVFGRGADGYIKVGKSAQVLAGPSKEVLTAMAVLGSIALLLATPELQELLAPGTWAAAAQGRMLSGLMPGFPTSAFAERIKLQN